MDRRALGLGLVILVSLVGWHYRQVMVVERRQWREGSSLAVSQRWWQAPEEKVGALKWDYQGVRVVCSRQVCRPEGPVQAGLKVSWRGKLQWQEDKWQITVSDASIINDQPGVVWSLNRINRLRGRVLSVYKQALTEPAAGLMAGVVLGEKAAISQTDYQALVATGTLHIIAASGFNVTIVAKVVLDLLLRFFKRKTAVVGAIGAIFIYVVMAGMSPAVVRAGIMGGLAFLSQAWGRDYMAAWALGLTGLIMVGWQPWLLTEPSFQLSMAATAGILWGSEYIKDGLETRYKRHKGLRWVIPDLATTLAATLATLPVTLYHFGQVSLIAPVVNVLVLWLIPPMMGLGMLGAAAGMVGQGIGNVCLWMSLPLVLAFWAIVSAFARLPWASMGLPAINGWIGAGWWLVLAAWWRGARQHQIEELNEA